MAFDLSSIQRGKSALPPRIVVYGDHKLGKSTFAAGAPDPIFICTEDGLTNIDANSFPICKSYDDVVQCIGTLLNEEHDFRTVVLDSLDWLEPLIWKHVAKAHGHDEIEDFGYGKGYIYAADQLRECLDGLNALRLERGMAVVLTAHCAVRRFDDPTAESYDRYVIKLHKHAAPIVEEWADAICFARMKALVAKQDVGFGKKIARGVGEGERVLCTEKRPAFDAGNRYGLKPELPLSWSAFADALSEAINH